MRIKDDETKSKEAHDWFNTETKRNKYIDWRKDRSHYKQYVSKYKRLFY